MYEPRLSKGQSGNLKTWFQPFWWNLCHKKNQNNLTTEINSASSTARASVFTNLPETSVMTASIYHCRVSFRLCRFQIASWWPYCLSSIFHALDSPFPLRIYLPSPRLERTDNCYYIAFGQVISWPASGFVHAIRHKCTKREQYHATNLIK